MAVFGTASSTPNNFLDNTINTEASVVITPIYPVPRESETVIVTAWAYFTLGAAITSYTLRLRRGPLVASTLLLAAVRSVVTPGQTVSDMLMFTEILTNFATVQYGLTFQATGETGTTAFNSMSISLLSLQ